MKNLTQLGRQLLEIWKQLGLNQRISVVFTALAVLGGLLTLAFWSSRTDFALLYGKLDEAEAGKVISALQESKTAYKSGPGGAIFVPSDKVYSIRMQLATRGIPRGEGVGYDIFDKSNFGLSDFVQRVNYLRAIQGELARTIGQLDEVEAARVLIVMPENRLIMDNQKKPTASVFIRVRGQAQLASSAINSIRFLVANAVEGLQVNRVAVVDNHGNTLADNTEEDSLVGMTSGQLAIRRNLEKYLSREVEDLLQKVLGAGQAVARVSAEVNFDTINRTEQKIDPENSVARTSTITDENTDSLSGPSGGVTGISANTGTDTNTASGGVANNSRTKKKSTTSEMELSKSTSTIMQAPGSIKRLTAAVIIAAKYEGAGASRKLVPRSEEELKRLRTLVQNALGVQLASDAGRTDELSLEEMPFNDQLATELTERLDKQQHRDFWVDLVKTLIYPAVAIAVLFGFWRALRTTKPENIPIGIPLGQFGLPGGGSSKPGNGHGAPEWAKVAEPGIVTVDVLNRLVRENPDNMSQAIRAWLSRSKSNPRQQ